MYSCMYVCMNVKVRKLKKKVFNNLKATLTLEWTKSSAV